MNLHRRINKLEQKHDQHFRVAYPALLDTDGNMFDANPPKGEVAGTVFRCNGQEISFIREPSEAYDGFQARAHEQAQTYFDRLVIWPFGSEWV
mgnify:CR=1 FL=1